MTEYRVVAMPHLMWTDATGRKGEVRSDWDAASDLERWLDKTDDLNEGWQLVQVYGSGAMSGTLAIFSRDNGR